MAKHATPQKQVFRSSCHHETLAPMIQTKRLSLRPFRADDLAQLGAVHGDRTVMAFSDTGPLSTLDQSAWLERAIQHASPQKLPLFLAIEEPSNPGVIGYISLSNTPGRVGLDEVELGFRLAVAHWGKGLATEAALAMISHATGLEGIAQVVAIVDPNNLPSLRVLEKLGMAHRGEVMFDGYDYPDHRFVLALDQAGSDRRGG